MAEKQEKILQNVEQERGGQAWINIEEIKGKQDDTLEKEYRSLARGLNAMIQINGLGQTLGFLKQKVKEMLTKLTICFSNTSPIG